MEHQLKIKPNYLKRLIDGTKTAEIRLNDRDYQVDDILKFYDPSSVAGDCYVYFRISHVHSGLGLERYYVCLSLKRIKL